MTGRPEVLVLQSHRHLPREGWMGTCVESVRRWAHGQGYAYRFEDDALLDRLAPDLREKTRRHPVIAADLARLAALDDALAEGYRTVLWLDADTLVSDPAAFSLPDGDYALGREVWIQPRGEGLRAYVKVHNAFLMFRPGNPFLAFYRHAAERIVRAHRGAMAPQLVGPKLLTALHNLADCPVAEHAAMLSPAVARDLLAGGGPALDLFHRHSRVAPAALNLCASLVGRDISEPDITAVIKRLTADPALLAPGR